MVSSSRYFFIRILRVYIVLQILSHSSLYGSVLFLGGGGENYYSPSSSKVDNFVGNLHLGLLVIQCPAFLLDLRSGLGEHFYTEVRFYLQSTCSPKGEPLFSNLGDVIGKTIEALLIAKILHIYFGMAGIYFLKNNRTSTAYFSPIIGFKSFEFWKSRLYLEFSSPLIGTSDFRYYRLSGGIEKKIKL